MLQLLKTRRSVVRWSFRVVVFHVLFLLLTNWGRAASGERELLVQALTNNDTSAQLVLIQRLSGLKDPLVIQALGAWRQGSVYLYGEEDQPKVPFLLEPATDAAGKARGLAIATGEPIKDAAGQPMLFLAADLTPADTTSKLRKAIKTTLDVLALSSPKPNIRRSNWDKARIRNTWRPWRRN
jgi:hypothetical protein